MELTTPSDLQPPTHPPTVILEGVTAGHLHVHMNSSGLLSAFLRVRLIYKSARTISDPCKFSEFMDIVCICVSTYFLLCICWLNISVYGQQQCSPFSVSQSGCAVELIRQFCICSVQAGAFISASVQLGEVVWDVFLVIFWFRIEMT